MSRSSPVLSTLFLVSIGHFIVDFMLAIWPAYKTMVGVDLALAGSIAACAALLGEGCQLFSGPLTDSGKGKAMVLLGVVMATSVIFITSTSSLWSLGLVIVCVYMGSGIFHPAASGLVGMLPHKRKGFLMAIFAAAGAVGLAIGQMVFSLLYYNVSGGTSLIAIPTILLLLWAARKKFGSQEVIQRARFRLRDLIPMMQHPSFRSLYLAMVCVQAVSWAVIFLIPDILLARGLPTWVCFGAGHMAYMMGAAALTIPAGMLADRVGERPVMIASIVGGAVALFFFVTVEQQSVAWTLLALFVAGGSIYSNVPNSVTLGNRLMPGRPGLVSTCIMGLVWVVAEGFSPLTSGLLTKLFVEQAAVRSLGVMCCLLVFSLMFLVRVRVPETAEASVPA